jgi:hypothetical protein
MAPVRNFQKFRTPLVKFRLISNHNTLISNDNPKISRVGRNYSNSDPTIAEWVSKPIT